MSTDEIKQLLPEDTKLLKEWANYLLGRYEVKLLDSLPQDVQNEFINELFSQVGKEKNGLFVEHYRYLLEKEPDRLLSCLPNMNKIGKTAVFTASLTSKDIATSRSIKEMIAESEKPVFVHSAVMKLQKSTFDSPQLSRDVYFKLIDTLDTESLKALAFSYSFTHFLKKDFDGIEMLASKVESCGMTFEKVAELLSLKARQLFIISVGSAEDTLKSQNKSVPWVPSSNWAVKEKLAEASESKNESRDITTEKAVTDIATEVDDHTQIEISKENPVDITVKPTDKTEIFEVKKDTEEIVDSAKTVLNASEPEMKDKATVVSDNSSELGSKSKSTPEKS